VSLVIFNSIADRKSYSVPGALELDLQLESPHLTLPSSFPNIFRSEFATATFSTVSNYTSRSQKLHLRDRRGIFATPALPQTSG
jgi:hypothetical protein